MDRILAQLLVAAVTGLAAPPTGWLSPVQLTNLRRAARMSFRSSASRADEDACLLEIVKLCDESLTVLRHHDTAETEETFRDALDSDAAGVPPDAVERATSAARQSVDKSLKFEPPEACAGFTKGEMREGVRLVFEALGKAFLLGHSADDWRGSPSVLSEGLFTLGIFGAGAAAAFASVTAYLRMSKRPVRRLSTVSPIAKGELMRVERLGGGSYGTVYRARWRKRKGTDVALKMSLIGLDSEVDVEDMSGALSELLAMSQLQAHPFILSAQDFFIHQDSKAAFYACIVMELCSGGNLHDLVCKHPDGLPLHLVDKYVMQVLEALDFAHHLQSPIIHRDIKPENILLDSKGDCRLSDFGLSVLIRRGKARDDVEEDASVVGTRAFMAPEWFGTFEEQTAAARSPSVDVWSLGCVLYECVTGEDVPTMSEGEGSLRTTIGVGQMVYESGLSSDALVEMDSKLHSKLAGKHGGDRLAKCYSGMVRINPADRSSTTALLGLFPAYAPPPGRQRRSQRTRAKSPPRPRAKSSPRRRAVNHNK